MRVLKSQIHNILLNPKSENSNKMIIFLCTNYSKEIVDYANTIDFDKVKIIIDNNDEIYSDDLIFQIDDDKCSEYGYVNSVTENGMITHVKKNPNSWDKAFYFICENDLDNCLILEEDVFIPKKSILKKILNIKSDLVVPGITHRKNSFHDWNWNIIETKINPPYYYSLVCAVKLSNTLIRIIKEYRLNNGHLFNHEAMIPTLALQNNLSFNIPIELKGIVASANWDISIMNIFKNYLYHPVKNISYHQSIRNIINTKSENCNPMSCMLICPMPYKYFQIPDFLKVSSNYSQ